MWSAPRARTASSFAVLHTPVTSAPNAFAIWTAKVPTPPDAPVIRTCCPVWTRPWSRTAWRAARAETGTAAAWSKDSLAGLGASLSGRARAYSANDASPMPNTASPGVKAVTLASTAATVPARLRPGLRYFGPRRRTPPGGWDRAGRPARATCLGPRWRMHPHEHLVLSDHGPGDLGDPQDVLGRGAVLVLDDRRHRLPSGGHPWRFHRCGRAVR